jgi:hypothetical protein
MSKPAKKLTQSSVSRGVMIGILLVAAMLLGSCGGGGGGVTWDSSVTTQPPPPAVPPPSIVLEGRVLDAEQIALSWTVGDLYTNQAYAVVVNGNPSAVTQSKGYLFAALPQTSYCFKIVVGILFPLRPFYAEGPDSNQVCLTTPSLPQLATGWSIREAGLGNGMNPAIARYGQAPQSGIYGCNALNSEILLGSTGTAIFGYLKPSTIDPIAPTFGVAGSPCGIAYDRLGGGVHAATRDASGIWYQSASLQLGQWWQTTPVLVAADAGPFSVAVDLNGTPLILYGKSGQVFLARYNGGTWTSELIGPGYIGWRSLAVAPDGSIFVLVGESGLAEQEGALRVMSRGFSGWTGVAIAADVAPWQTRGSGSIVAPAAGDVRVAFRKSFDGGSTKGVGYLVLKNGVWSETIIERSAFVSPPALAVDASGESLISWGDEHFDLRLSRRSGGSWQTLHIDALGRLAEATDIEVDVDGNIFILYTVDGRLKVAVGK